jgi:hypothetical protein
MMRRNEHLKQHPTLFQKFTVLTVTLFRTASTASIPSARRLHAFFIETSANAVLL